MRQAEKPIEPVLRPRTRRASVDLNCCQDCKEVLTNDNWSPSMRGETGHRPRHICRSCWTERQRRYTAKKDPEQLRAMKRASRARLKSSWSDERREQDRRRLYGRWLERNYGLTINDYDAIYEAQEGRCRICTTTEPRGRGGFHVDHCHETGIVRGLLCTGCNMMLGLVKDNKETLMRAIEYLAANDNHKIEDRQASGGKAY